MLRTLAVIYPATFRQRDVKSDQRAANLWLARWQPKCYKTVTLTDKSVVAKWQMIKKSLKLNQVF